MLLISANSNFGTISNPGSIPNSYIDLNGRSCDQDLFGTLAINQAIENVITTMPGECLFNTLLFSPLYEILFDNYSEGLEEQIFSKIELFVPIKVLRDQAQFDYDPAEHILYVSIPWVSLDGTMHDVFKRHIGR